MGTKYCVHVESMIGAALPVTRMILHRKNVKQTEEITSAPAGSMHLLHRPRKFHQVQANSALAAALCTLSVVSICVRAEENK